MHWDPARVSAAIPSGVGFLGGGLIIKYSEKDDSAGVTYHVVKELNTGTHLFYFVVRLYMSRT